MKFLKTLGIVLVVLIAVLAIIPMFLPTAYSVERTAIIEQPKDMVYAQVAGFESRTQWDPWLTTEPSAKVTFEGPAQGAGAKYSWNGETIGSGSLEITDAKEGKEVNSTLIFMNADGSAMPPANIQWMVEEVENGTKVTWRMHGENNAYFARYYGVLMDAMIGKDLEKGLSNLKTFTEELPAPVATEAPTETEEDIQEEEATEVNS